MTEAKYGRATGPRCSGTTKRGTRCTHNADEGRTLCILHDPTRRDEMRAMLADRGRNGRRKRAEAEREGKRGDRVPLETVAQIRALVERAAATVENGAGDAVLKANALARLAAVALELRRGSDLEREVAAMREEVQRMREREETRWTQ